MILAIILVLAGIYLENRFSPRISVKDDDVLFSYKAKRKDVNKVTQKLFSI